MGVTYDMMFRDPDARMILADGQLTLSYGGIPREGSPEDVFRQMLDRGVYVANMYVLGNDTHLPEIAVRFVVEDEGVFWAKDLVLKWALAVGYARVWFDDVMHVLVDEECPTGEATVVCPTCFTRWAADDLDFWIAVRSARRFPGTCGNCSSTMPEWTVTKTFAQHAV